MSLEALGARPSVGTTLATKIFQNVYDIDFEYI